MNYKEKNRKDQKKKKCNKQTRQKKPKEILYNKANNKSPPTTPPSNRLSEETLKKLPEIISPLLHYLQNNPHHLQPLLDHLISALSPKIPPNYETLKLKTKKEKHLKYSKEISRDMIIESMEVDQEEDGVQSPSYDEEVENFIHPFTLVDEEGDLPLGASSFAYYTNQVNIEIESLFTAIIEGDIDFARSLILENSCKLDSKNDEGYSILHLCAQKNNLNSLLKHILSIEHLKGLLNEPSEEGSYGIHYAVQNDNIEAIKILVENGTSLNVKDLDGKTPLHRACESSSLETIQTLLSFPSISVNCQDLAHNTPLHYALWRDDTEMHGAVLYSLLLHSANWEIKNRNAKKPLEGGLNFGIPHFIELVKILQDFNPTLKSTKWEIDPPSSLVYDRSSLIGRGGFGSVYKGKLHGTVCAVKEITISPQNTLEKINHEIGIMGDVHHPKLVLLLGARTTKDYVCIITEYIDGGCLRDYLPKIKYEDYTEKLIISMTMDICIAMAWLHSRKPPVYHRDLHTRNILVSFQQNTTRTYGHSQSLMAPLKPQLKLCDFGLSLVRGERGGPLKRNNLYKRIMPPDLLESSQDYSTKSDVYMFGLVLYELVTREKAKDVKVILKNLNDLRPRAGDITKRLLVLLEECISDSPMKRPEFEKGIIPFLEKIIQEFKLDDTEMMSEPPLSNIIDSGYVF